MKILDAWPTKARKLTQVEKAQPYLDGRIYRFDVEDCHELFGMTIESTYEHSSDEENARHTEYLRSNALQNLEAILRSGVRLTHGPYQSRLKFDKNTLMFQFTGLQECRFKGCDEQADHEARGYCEEHYQMKLKEGKV